MKKILILWLFTLSFLADLVYAVAPLANDDYWAVEVNATSEYVNVTINDSDSDGILDKSTVTVIEGPINGTIVPNPEGTFYYTPNVGFIGNDTFSYTIDDDTSTTSNIATVSLSVQVPLKLNANITFSGAITFLDNSLIDGRIKRLISPLTNLAYIHSIADTLETNSSTINYEYSGNFLYWTADQELSLSLKSTLQENASSEYHFYVENNVTSDKNITTDINLLSLTIPIDNIGNMRYIMYRNHSTGTNGFIWLYNATSNIASSYVVPIISGDHSIYAYYVDGTLKYYDMSINGWVTSNPGAQTISDNTVLTALSATSTNLVASSISHIYDYYRAPGFSNIIVSFDVNDTVENSLNISVTQTNNIVNITAPTTVTANTVNTLVISPIDSTTIGDTEISLTATNSSGVSYTRNFHIFVGSRYDIVSFKEGATVSGIPYTGDLYLFSSSLDNGSQLVKYEKIEVKDSFHSEYTEIKNRDGIVEVITQTEVISDTLQYEDINISNTALSTLYTDYGTPFTFNDTESLGQKIYITYPTTQVNISETVHNSNNSSYSSLASFMLDQVSGKTRHGILRNNTRDKLLILDESELSQTSGKLVEVAEDGNITGLEGSWSIETIDSKELLLLDTSSLSGYKNNVGFMLDTIDNKVKFGEYKVADDVYSYILLNKSAKDELYYSISSNPKIAVPVVNGYTYVSLSNSKTLCDTSLQSIHTTLCDQNNTLESIFGSTTLLKHEEDWIYWDSSDTVNASYLMNKFSTISALDGAIVKSTEAKTLYIPYDNDVNTVNDYEGMSHKKSYLLSNNKEQTISEIVASVTAKSKTIEYILVLRDGVWNIYAPLNDTSINPAIPRITEIKRDESYWIIFDDTGVATERIAATCLTGGDLDNLSGKSYITYNSLIVDCINNASISNSIFNLTKPKIAYTTTGNLTTDYTAIKDSLSGMLNLELTADASDLTALDTNMLVTILIKDSGSSYAAVATDATFKKVSNELSVTVPASENVLRISTNINGTNLVATKTTSIAKSITSLNSVININAVGIVDNFVNNVLIGDAIKQYLVNFVTKPGSYDVYLLINNKTDSATFVGDTNSITISQEDVTNLNLLVDTSGVVYTTTNAKAVQVSLTIE